MARTGETRKRKLPLKIDRLPASVIESIRFLRVTKGKTFDEIERQSQAPYSPYWTSDGGGFVDWEHLEPEVLAEFKERKLPHSNLNRWWDLRVEQVSANVAKLSAQAEKIAHLFASSAELGDDTMLQKATRDLLLGLLAEESSPQMQLVISTNLRRLAELQVKAKANTIRERAVAVEEQSLQMKLDELKCKAGELVKDAQKAGESAAPMTREEILDRVREIYGVQ